MTQKPLLETLSGFAFLAAPISTIMRPLLQNRMRAQKPVIGIKDAEPETLSGDWWVVMPEGARDILYLQLLGSHQRYANFQGEGILVSENAIPKN